jgi:hypothetical protein
VRRGSTERVPAETCSYEKSKAPRTNPHARTPLSLMYRECSKSISESEVSWRGEREVRKE